MMMTMMIVTMIIFTTRMIVMVICRVIADRLREEEVDGEALLSLTQVLTNLKQILFKKKIYSKLFTSNYYRTISPPSWTSSWVPR